MNTLHVISHTHWDREWYQTFQQFRLRLVGLVDGLLDLLEHDPNYKYFMLDGQTIVLDDYLHMRPEKEQILRDHIQSGRIVIGPWHILPDMYLVGPEAHIRNLLQGDRTCRKFGPKMLVGYIPDPFGHPAQVPQILQGFNIDVACLWRGLDEEPTEFWWQAPNGSRVLMAYLRDSYSNGSGLPVDNLPAFAAAVAAEGQKLGDHSAVHDQLIMLGTDHMLPPWNTSAAIAYADQNLKETHVIHSTLSNYVAAVCSGIQGLQSPVVEGELRACKRMHLLPGVLSTRMWIKQRNAASENLLTKWVEPFSTFAELVTASTQPTFPQGPNLREPAPLIRQTWRLLMENHPHDSICGCSIDQVHDEMKVRFDQVDHIGEELTRQSLENLAAAINTHSGFTDHKLSIVVFNPHAFACTGAVTVELTLPPEVTGFEIVAENGNVLPYETEGLGRQELFRAVLDGKGFRSAMHMVNEGHVNGLGVRAFKITRQDSSAFFDITLVTGKPDQQVWERGVQETQVLLDDPSVTSFHILARSADIVKATFCADAVPGLGWRTFYVRAKETSSEAASLSLLARAVLPLAGRIASTAVGHSLISRLQNNAPAKTVQSIENEFFKVQAEPEGTFSVLDKKNGSIYRGLNRFVDGGDCGDEYNYSPPAIDPQLLPRLKSISVHQKALHQTLTLNLVLKVPAQLNPDRKSRSKATVEIPIVSTITLTNGVPRLDVHTELENTAQDHRLRVHFPTPFKAESADYDGHFEIVRRKLGISKFDRQTWIEDPRPEVPQRAFTRVSEGDKGFILANRGLPEVEVLRTADGAEIALTLLRCVGWLSRDDFQTRRGHAGPGMKTPGAQMPGKWAFDYSIIPPVEGAVGYQQAYAFEIPLRASSSSLHAGELSDTGSFVAVSDPRFVVSTVKQAEAGKGWIVRGYNPGSEALEVKLTPFKRFDAAARVNLAEQTQSDLTVAKATGSVSLTVKSHEIVSVLFSE